VGRIWDKGIKNGVLDGKMDVFPRGNLRTRILVLVQLAWRAHGEFPSSATMFWVFRVLGGSIRAFRNDSNLMYLTLVKLSKPLENIK